MRRLLQKSDDRRDAPPVGVMSHRAWTQFFAHDPVAHRRDRRCERLMARLISVYGLLRSRWRLSDCTEL
jgi:hypothetical protein